MIRLVFFLSMILLSGASLFSQQHYLNKIFKPDSVYAAKITALLVQNDTIIAVGDVQDTSKPKEFGMFFSKFDSLGNLLVFRTYFPDEDHYYYSGYYTGLISTSDGGYLFSAYYEPGSADIVIKLDHSGNQQWATVIKHPNEAITTVEELAETEDGYMLAGWVSTSGVGTFGFAAKISKTGNVLWSKKYISASEPASQSLPFMYKNNENSFFLSGAITNGQGADSPNYWGKSWIVEIDSSGSIIWEWKNTIQEKVGGAKVGSVFGNEIVFVCSKYKYMGMTPPYYTVLIQPMSKKIKKSTGETVWFSPQGPFNMSYNSGWFDMEPNPIIGGWDLIGVAQNLPNGFVIGAMCAHVDDNGNTRWFRQDTVYRSPLIQVDLNYLTSMGHLSSGSIIAGGWVQKAEPNYHNEAWLYKYALDGCVAPDDCAPQIPVGTSLPASVRERWQVFPNPAKGSTQLYCAQAFDGKMMGFELFTLNGEKILSMDFLANVAEPVEVNLSGISSGAYFFRVISEGIGVSAGKILVVR